MPNQTILNKKIDGEGRFITQPETLAVSRNFDKLFIGIPKETTFQEHRVALVPHSVSTLVALGHRVMIESGAGLLSRFTDHEYSEAGAEIVHSREEVFKCNLLLKVTPPTLADIDLMHPNQVIISPIHLPTLKPEIILGLQKKTGYRTSNGVYP